MISRREFLEFTGALAATVLAGLALSGCGNGGSSTSAESPASDSSSADAPAEASAGASSAVASRVLVTCFSATGNTRPIAKAAARALGADYFETVPAEPYSDEDLNYNDGSTRATEEQNSPTARPELASTPDLGAYDVVLVGHPIWWGKAPRLICTLLEGSGLSGKAVAEFCTSGGSGIDEANAELRALVPGADWIGARRFAAGASDGEVADWVASLGIDKGK